ncbi:hypothetical protein ACWIUD_12050 [Helicobacter sp. 23-1044]
MQFMLNNLREFCLLDSANRTSFCHFEQSEKSHFRFCDFVLDSAFLV